MSPSLSHKNRILAEQAGPQKGFPILLPKQYDKQRKEFKRIDGVKTGTVPSHNQGSF